MGATVVVPSASFAVRARYSVLVVGLLVENGASAQSQPSVAEPSADAAPPAVEPATVPPSAAPSAGCPPQEVRTARGRCVPRYQPLVGGFAAEREPAPIARFEPRVEPRVAKRRKERRPGFALTFQPLAAIVAPELVDGVDYVLPFGLEIGGPVVALDLRVSVVGGNDDGVLGLIGPRVFPKSHGLEGFYVVPRVGTASYAGLIVQLELGYEAWAGPFVIELGAGVDYSADDEKVFPLLDLSLGLGT